MSVTPPPFWYAVFRFFRRYAVRKGSVRKNPVISYADNNILLSKGTIFFKKK